MSKETALQLIQEGQIIESKDLSLMGAPSQVLEQAQIAAAALTDVISKKTKPVKFNGEQYLEFEDWQTLGRFYGITAIVTETKYVEFGDFRGFEAKADAMRNGELIISSAEAMCLSDERNWSSKPLYQLKSMAQTRACAKALRNVLSWVVVLAGYKPTPAEEMQEVINSAPAPKPVLKSKTIASPEQVKELNDLVEKLKVEKTRTDPWLNKAKVKTFSEMEEEIIIKCIEALKNELAEETIKNKKTESEAA